MCSSDLIDSFASIPFPLPIPKPKPYLSAREVFLYLVLFTAFYTSAYALGSLAFDFINRIFPDPLFSPAFSRGADGANDDIRWNVSTLLVSFPLFLYMFRHVNNAVNLDPTSGRQNPGGG